MRTTQLSTLALVVACFLPLAFTRVVDESANQQSPRGTRPATQLAPDPPSPARQAVPMTQARRPYVDYQDYDPNEYPPWFGYGDSPAEPPYPLPPPQDPQNVADGPPYANAEEDQGTAELPLPRGGEGGRGGKMDHPGSPGRPGHPGRPEGRDGYSGYGGPGGFGGYGGHHGLLKKEHGVGKRMLRVRKRAH